MYRSALQEHLKLQSVCAKSLDNFIVEFAGMTSFCFQYQEILPLSASPITPLFVFHFKNFKPYKEML
jgi:hypothetical protein